jgi:Na+-translocating ferredoxin:NAD+ oxidoreductase RnfD subunit
MRLHALVKILVMGIVVGLWGMFLSAYVEGNLPTNPVLHALVYAILLMVVVVPFILWVLKPLYKKPPPPT